MRIQKHYFWLDIVNMHYYFLNTKSKFIKALEHFNIDTDIEDIDGKCLLIQKNGETVILIGLFNGSDVTLVHECTHAGLYTFDAIGQQLHYNNEFLPYLIATIFDKCKAI